MFTGSPTRDAMLKSRSFAPERVSLAMSIFVMGGLMGAGMGAILGGWSDGDDEATGSAFLLGAAVSYGLARRASRQQAETGQRPQIWPLMVVLMLIGPLAVWYAQGAHFVIEWPVLRGFNFQGGNKISPEYGALLIGLALAVLAEAGGRPEDIVRMTWYVADKPSYLARSREIGAVWRDVIGCYTSTMSAVEVSSLMVEGALLQIEATAVIPRENKTNGLRQGDYGHE